MFSICLTSLYSCYCLLFEIDFSVYNFNFRVFYNFFFLVVALGAVINHLNCNCLFGINVSLITIHRNCAPLQCWSFSLPLCFTVIQITSLYIHIARPSTFIIVASSSCLSIRRKKLQRKRYLYCLCLPM